jgi:hypothetical protein
MSAHALANAFDHARYPFGVKGITVHHPEAECGIAGQIVPTIQRPANTDMDRGIVPE